MAENPLIGGTAAFALGTLSKAAGQDFLSPMLNDVRDKDMFLFQQREAVRLREESRKRFNEERKASRRGLVSALQATGSVLPEDVVAAGGVDAISELDDTEFEMLATRLSDQQAQRLSDADLEASLRGMLPAIGLPPLGPGPHSRSQLLELKAQADMNLLMKREGAQQRDETTRAMRTAVAQAGRDIGALFERSQAVSVDTLRQAFGRHAQAAARLGSGGADLSDADYENLQGELNSMADEIRRQQVHVGLNALAKGSPGEIIAGLTKLDPDLRTLALERPSINAAWGRVEFAANALIGLGPDGAQRLGMGELYEQTLQGDPVQDGALAQSLFASVGKLSGAQQELKRLEAADAGMTEAKAAAAAVATLGFARSDLDLNTYINPKTGDFNSEQFHRDAYSDQLLTMDQMDPVAARDFQTTLAAAGAPTDMQRMAAKAAQRGLAQEIGETRPENLLDLATQREQIEKQEDVAHEALGQVLSVVPDLAYAEYVSPEEAAHGAFGARKAISPKYLAKLRGSVEATGKPLMDQQAAVASWGQALIEKIQDARRAGDEELASAYETAAAEQNLLADTLRVRASVRGEMIGMLRNAAPFFADFSESAGGTDDKTKVGVLQAFGVDSEKATEGAASLTDTASIFSALREQAAAKLKDSGLSKQQIDEAVTAELDRLYELTQLLDAALQEPETLKRFQQSKIVSGEAGDAPALELLAYLL